jgi:hypothetical protein
VQPAFATCFRDVLRRRKGQHSAVLQPLTVLWGHEPESKDVLQISDLNRHNAASQLGRPRAQLHQTQDYSDSQSNSVPD